MSFEDIVEPTIDYEAEYHRQKEKIGHLKELLDEKDRDLHFTNKKLSEYILDSGHLGTIIREVRKRVGSDTIDEMVKKISEEYGLQDFVGDYAD